MFLVYHPLICPSQFDYMFHLDGTIEVRLSVSGYLQAGFWELSQDGYGTKIRETTSLYTFPPVPPQANVALWWEIYATTLSITRQAITLLCGEFC
jgi:hypothetical protein